jgi:hypothetical protein
MSVGCSSGWRPGRRSATPVLVAAVAALAGCSEVTTAEKVHYQPARIEPVKGRGDLVRVTLTREGAERIGIKTEVVRRRGRGTVIPYAALLYEGSDGSAFVYTNPEGLTYVREAVTVDRVAKDRVLITRGPRVGTRVVTVGAPEVHGAELEFGEY